MNQRTDENDYVWPRWRINGLQYALMSLLIRLSKRHTQLLSRSKVPKLPLFIACLTEDLFSLSERKPLHFQTPFLTAVWCVHLFYDARRSVIVFTSHSWQAISCLYCKNHRPEGSHGEKWNVFFCLKGQFHRLYFKINGDRSGRRFVLRGKLFQ